MVSKGAREPYLLLIDDDQSFLSSLTHVYTRQGFNVRTAHDGASATTIIRRDPIAVAVVDVQLPDSSGPELLQRLQAESPSTQFIALTGFGSAQVAADMLNAGARDYFTKPIRDWRRLDRMIREHFAQWRALQTRERSPVPTPRGASWQKLRADKIFSQMKGQSSAMRALIQEVMLKGSLGETPVLIRGESGTGKELVARALHEVHHGGEDRPFVAVNCAAIPHDLFESELFGHEQGSFTGAAQRRAGLCDAAAGGTLFLDEVGEMPGVLQAKLLRVLEQRTYRRVGSDRLEILQARVIAATNVDLESAIGARTFREDLYYRLSGQEILVPPLRLRREDISLLAYHFVDKYNRTFDRAVKKISPAAVALLESHDWQRNNVRELDREIQRAMVYCADRTELPAELLFQGNRPETTEDGLPEMTDLLSLPYKDAIGEGSNRLRRWFLQHHLQQADWNQSQVAKNARMQRTSIRNLMDKLGIEEP
ncbi:MAG: DNA-binding NtrC family response regulator [Myxococcota bacterium]|jgi:DNA-binding NtrC family response regulator